MSTVRPVHDPEPPTIAEAMTHVVDVGERLVSHRLELALVELRKTIENAQQAVQLILGAALLAGAGWIFAMVAALAWLEPALGSRAGAAALVAVLQFALAGALIGLRRVKSGSR
jgi:uncharacterized membrane protein YqjE